MGFIRSSSYDGKEMAEKSQKRISSKPATTTTEVVLNECCKKCRKNKILLFAQAVVNIVLMILIIILFVMVSGLKSDLNDKSLVRRAKSANPVKGYRMGRNLNSSRQKQSEINISKLESISSPSNLTNESSTLNSNYTAFPTKFTVPVTTTTKMPFLEALEVLDEKVIMPEVPVRDTSEMIKYDQIFVSNITNCTCIGRRGPPGKPGHKGERGRRGKKGIMGGRGPPGPRGDKGQRGMRGRTGKAGPRGDVGSVGVSGPMGPAGPKGDSGRLSIDDHPVVHLTGYAFAAQLKSMPQGLVTNLQHTQGFGDLVGGFKYEKGIITIPKYGFYHVYSQVFFQHDEPGLDPMLVHYVYLFRNTEKWILMQSYVSKPEHTRNGQAFFTTNTNGVFRFMKGDKIALGVEPVHLPLISYAESTTFFGAYLI